MLAVDDYIHYRPLAWATRHTELKGAMYLAGQYKRQRAAIEILEAYAEWRGHYSLRYLRGSKRFKTAVITTLIESRPEELQNDLHRARRRRTGPAWASLRTLARRRWSTVLACVFARIAWKRFIEWQWRPGSFMALKAQRRFESQASSESTSSMA